MYQVGWEDRNQFSTGVFLHDTDSHLAHNRRPAVFSSKPGETFVPSKNAGRVTKQEVAGLPTPKQNCDHTPPWKDSERHKVSSTLTEKCQ